LVEKEKDGNKNTIRVGHPNNETNTFLQTKIEIGQPIMRGLDKEA
jgi:hypothetical protein